MGEITENTSSMILYSLAQRVLCDADQSFLVDGNKPDFFVKIASPFIREEDLTYENVPSRELGLFLGEETSGKGIFLSALEDEQTDHFMLAMGTMTKNESGTMAASTFLTYLEGEGLVFRKQAIFEESVSFQEEVTLGSNLTVPGTLTVGEILEIPEKLLITSNAQFDVQADFKKEVSFRKLVLFDDTVRFNNIAHCLEDAYFEKDCIVEQAIKVLSANDQEMVFFDSEKAEINVPTVLTSTFDIPNKFGVGANLHFKAPGTFYQGVQFKGAVAFNQTVTVPKSSSNTSPARVDYMKEYVASNSGGGGGWSSKKPMIATCVAATLEGTSYNSYITENTTIYANNTTKGYCFNNGTIGGVTYINPDSNGYFYLKSGYIYNIRCFIITVADKDVADTRGSNYAKYASPLWLSGTGISTHFSCTGIIKQISTRRFISGNKIDIMYRCTSDSNFRITNGSGHWYYEIGLLAVIGHNPHYWSYGRSWNSVAYDKNEFLFYTHNPHVIIEAVSAL